jgi:hypothetical protein
VSQVGPPPASASSSALVFLCLSVCLTSSPVFCLGGSGAVDGKCGLNPGGARPVLHAAEDPWWPDPEFHHPADLPLHLREQAYGCHRAGESQPTCSFPTLFMVSVTQTARGLIPE